MQKSMLKKFLVIQFVFALFLSSKSNAQTADDIQNIALLLGDALFFQSNTFNLLLMPLFINLLQDGLFLLRKRNVGKLL
jgi:hypothetical protein